MHIVLEGLDGAGKTTMMGAVTDELLSQSKGPVMQCKAPGGTKVGEVIRELCITSDLPVCVEAMDLLLAADYKQLEEEIITPYLRYRWSIVQDRGMGSVYAYGLSRRGLEYKDRHMYPDYYGLVHVPDLYIYLDISVDTFFERLEEEDRITEMGRDYMELVRQNYLAFGDGRSYWRAIDAEQPFRDVWNEVRSVIRDEIQEL